MLSTCKKFLNQLKKSQRKVNRFDLVNIKNRYMSKNITQKNEQKISICHKRPMFIHINKKDAQIKNREPKNQMRKKERLTVN